MGYGYQEPNVKLQIVFGILALLVVALVGFGVYELVNFAHPTQQVAVDYCHSSDWPLQIGAREIACIKGM